MEDWKKNKKMGFGMIEAIIGIAISSIMVLAFMASMLYITKASSISEEKLKGSLYAREGIEIAKDLEKTNWNELDTAYCTELIKCYPKIVDGSWTLEIGTEPLEEGFYTRSIYIEPVYRDELAFPNNVTETGGIYDPDTKKIVSIVEWNHRNTTQKAQLETYVYKN